MELQCGGHKGGWTRIAQFDTSRGDACPSGWTLMTTPGANSKTVCRSGNDNGGCHSTTFTNYNISFYKVCGQAKGYQKGTTDGYSHKVTTINQPYVDGLSITLGDPRKHVWTYAVGQNDERSNYDRVTCPCGVIKGPDSPSFVGDHYYCESGNSVANNFTENAYYTTDPLWDGLECSLSVNCCTQPDMPWFLRQFATAQETFIEARICKNGPFSDEDILVESMELYIQ